MKDFIEFSGRLLVSSILLSLTTAWNNNFSDWFMWIIVFIFLVLWTGYDILNKYLNCEVEE